MENKFKGYYWDKESKKPASAEEINAKIEEAKDPSITFKLSELENLNVDTLKKKLEEGKEEITFYGKCFALVNSMLFICIKVCYFYSILISRYDKIPLITIKVKMLNFTDSFILLFILDAGELVIIAIPQEIANGRIKENK